MREPQLVLLKHKNCLNYLNCFYFQKKFLNTDSFKKCFKKSEKIQSELLSRVENDTVTENHYEALFLL